MATRGRKVALATAGFVLLVPPVLAAVSAAAVTARAVSSPGDAMYSVSLLGIAIGMVACVALLVKRRPRAACLVAMCGALVAAGTWGGSTAVLWSYPVFRVADATVSVPDGSLTWRGYCVSAPDSEHLWYIEAEDRTVAMAFPGVFGEPHVSFMLLRREGEPERIGRLEVGERLELVPPSEALAVVDFDEAVSKMESEADGDLTLVASGIRWECADWRQDRAPLDEKRPLNWYQGTDRDYRVEPMW